MPCYNASATLKGAIESVVNQSHTDWELVIVDDASTDKSKKIAQSYAKKYPNITFLQNKTNQGCYYSRNRALYYMKNKKWDVFTIHDADDTSTPDRFQLYIDTFEKNPKLSILLGIFNGKRYTMMSDNPQIKYVKEGIATGVNFYKKDIFKTFGYFWDTRYGGDMEYTMRIGEFLSRICPEDKPFLEFRDEIIKRLSYKYAYCYTTGFHTEGNLTQTFNKKERLEFRDYFQNKHFEWNLPEDFYINFEPHPEDITL